MPTSRPPRRRRRSFWGALGAACVGALLFLSGIVANLLSSDLEDRLKALPGYPGALYVAGGLFLALAIGLAVRERLAADEEASVHRSVATEGGDYAEGNIDKRTGVFVESGGVAHIHQPAAPASPDDARNRAAMIAQQRLIWIEGVLEKSLWNDALIALGLAERPTAVQRPYHVTSRVQGKDTPLPDQTRILDLYNQWQGALLILGAPGAGKTTLLLELMRDLLVRAEQDPVHPIPVKFDLSAWGEDKPPLADWLATQLNRQYGVPRKIAPQWVAADRILPLLDGLDEVAEERRVACAVAINAYRQEHGLLPMVVCCREREYQELPFLLLLGAVVAQPLSEAQVQQYLQDGGRRLAGVRKLLRDDPDLLAEDTEHGRLLATPLMLSIVTLAYADVPAVRLRGITPAQRRAEVFDAYLERGLTRADKTVDPRFPKEQTLERLRWLAWQLQQTNRSTYLLEEMQFDWVNEGWAQRLVSWSQAVVVGLACMTLGGVAFGLLSEPAFTMRGVLVGGLAGGVLGGLIGGLQRGTIETVDYVYWSWQRTRASWPYMLLVGLIFGLIVVVISKLTGREFGGQLGSQLGGLVLGQFGGLVYGLLSGLTFEVIPTRTKPNTGIWSSFRNGLLIMLISSAFFGLLIGVASVLLGLLGSRLLLELLVVLLLGLLLGILLGALSGLHAALTHAMLRLLLAQQRLLPLDITPFCDYCATRIILRRVGSGWIFVHRLLLEHLAVAYQRELEQAHVRRLIPVQDDE